MQSVTPDRSWRSWPAADQQQCCPRPTARLRCRRWGRGWSISCRFVNWWCWSFTMRRLPLPSPCFWQPTILLFFLLICSIRHVHVLRVASLPLYVTVQFALLGYTPFCSVFSPGHSRFPSQEFLPSSDPSICSWHYPDALILGPLKTWLFWSYVSLKAK